jgi:hypothetical protein
VSAGAADRLRRPQGRLTAARKPEESKVSPNEPPMPLELQLSFLSGVYRLRTPTGEQESVDDSGHRDQA